MKIEFLNGEAAKAAVTHADALTCMREVFQSLSEARSLNFPSARGHGSDPHTRFGVKLAYDGARQLPGLKIGSYWPRNIERGLPNHGSTTILLDDVTGFPAAIIEATWLNALRTSASDALAVDLLASPDARRLTILGTGNQAFHEAKAIALVRPLENVTIVGRDLAKAERVAVRLCEEGLTAQTGTEEAIADADIVVTVTASRESLFEAGLVRSGTHVSAMGADGPGKRELPPELCDTSFLVADDPLQSIAIGEFQHLSNAAMSDRVVALADILCGKIAKPSAGTTTIYDSSGIGLQDVAIARLALDRARAQGATTCLPF